MRTQSSKKVAVLPSHADVGARLRALRNARGLSVNELALRAGVSVGTVSQVERNKANPSVRILERLRQALVAARAVDAGAIAKSYENNPAKIKDAVHRERVRAVAKALGEAPSDPDDA